MIDLEQLLAKHVGHGTRGEAVKCYVCGTGWPCLIHELAWELTAARKVVAAADLMAMAYAGEMASRSAGLELRGFPMLEAYQSLMVALAEYNEVVK